MLYDAYEKKILKISNVLHFIRKHALIILLATGLFLAATVTFLVTKGMTGQTTCPQQITYGDSLQCDANAFLSRVRFEYRAGNGDWSETQPFAPGTYSVRAVGNSITGKPRYGAESTFVILPRALDVQVSDTSVMYGEMPRIAPTLPFGDTLKCTRVIYEDILQASTNVTPDATTVRIFSKDGTDVTEYYLLRMVTAPISITPRPLTVMVEDASQTYNAQKLTYDKYDITVGTLAQGDSLQASFDKWLIDAGNIQNQPVLRVLNSDARDVTHHYTITEQIGKLIVKKRPLLVTTGTATPLTYDAQSHSYPHFTLNADTPLVEGHRLELLAAPDFTDAGVHENTLTFRVLDGNDEDRTSNYSFLITYGNIEIKKRPVTVSTRSDTWTYDAQKHFLPTPDAPELCQGHTCVAQNAIGITDAGTVSNVFTVQILDDAKADVTKNYAPTYRYGTLTVLKRTVTVQITDTEHTYDGLAHEGGIPVVAPTSPHQLIEGHVLGGSVTGTQTDVGDGEATLPVPLVKDGERDVSANYQITVLPGVIKVTPRPILIVITNAEKDYDGTPLTSTAFEVNPVVPLTFALVEGHTVKDLQTRGSQTDAGSSKNIYQSCRIYDGDREVTYNYERQHRAGTLTVKPRPITVTSGSAQKLYDGTPLVCHDPITLTGGSLVLDHYLDMRATGSITQAGVAPNIIEGTVRNGKHQDVGSNYQILPNTGKLEVLAPNQIVVTTGSAKAPYSGTPLTCNTVSHRFLSGSLSPGHHIALQATGSQTEIGQSYNTYSILITDQNNEDVTYLYEITDDLGLLWVYDPNEDDDNEDDDLDPPKLDDSGDLTGSSDDENDEKTVVMLLNSNYTGKIYLRLTAFGDFKGQSFAAATPYPHTLDGAYGYNYLTGIALQNAGMTPSFVEIQNFTNQYLLPYYLGLGLSNYELQSSDVHYTGTGSAKYSLPYYVYTGTGTDLQNKLGTYSAAEIAYQKFVHENYLNMDTPTRTEMERIIKEQGFDKNDPEVIARVAAYVRSVATYVKNYNSAVDNAPNAVLAFLKYKEGVCRQFAATATMLFRALDIPARYTIGYVGETVAGKEVEIVGGNAHAWVEVYVNGLGWIPVEVTGGTSDTPTPPPEPSKPVIEITPAYQSKHYDGAPLYAQNELAPSPALSELLDQRYTYTLTVTGERTEIGYGESTISSFTLYDPSGKDVTDLYEVVYVPGVLEVFPPTIKLIRIYLYQLQKYYDGSPLYYENGDFDILDLEEGLHLDLQMKIFLTTVNYLTLNDINQNLDEYAEYRVTKNGTDVTAQYRILFVLPEGASENYVPIRVDPRPLEMTTNSAEKIYDGTPLLCSGATISMGSLLSGHRIQQFAITGTQTEVGESECFITPGSIAIFDGEGNDVTFNYDIVIKPGKLTVLSPDS